MCKTKMSVRERERGGEGKFLKQLFISLFLPFFSFFSRRLKYLFDNRLVLFHFSLPLRFSSNLSRRSVNAVTRHSEQLPIFENFLGLSFSFLSRAWLLPPFRSSTLATLCDIKFRDIVDLCSYRRLFPLFHF